VSAPFRHTYRVVYADCTIGNHIYYSRYLDILEEARGEFFRSIGFPLLTLQAEGTIFPAIECSIKYIKPARYDDLLQIRLWLPTLGKIRLRCEFDVTRSGDRIIRGMTEHVCTDLADKPKRVPDVIASALQPYVMIDSPLTEK
jgi:acyl-CoA thioester hydrolase